MTYHKALCVASPEGDQPGCVLDRLRDALLVLDTSGRVVGCTQSAAGLLGHSDRALLGTDLTRWIDQRDRAAFAAGRSADGGQWAPTRLRLGPPAPPVVAHLLWSCPNRGSVVALEAAVGRIDQGLQERDPKAVTVLRGRDWLYARLQAALDVTDGRHVSLLQLDLDDFRSINDAFGDQVGDAVLKEVTERLDVCADGGVAARLGGDEFVLLLANCASAVEAEEAAQHLMAQLSLPVAVHDQELAVQVSMGVATAVAGNARADELMREASLATAAAKAQPGSRYIVYRPQLREAAEERTRLVTELSAGVDRGELRTVFQPIVGAAEGAVLALETLVRWEHPRRGLLAAGEFVPQAEAVGLIGKVDRWVLRHACAQAASWDGPLAHVPITVNMSALSVSSSALGNEVEAALADSGLQPSRLIVELTETALLERVDCVAKQLLALKTLGVRVALDDFGTGYSSLAYLERLPFDWLKIDGSYSRRAAQDKRAQTLLGSTIQLADALGMAVIVEGIELAAQARLLRALGVDLFQGYFFGPPVQTGALVDAVEAAGDRAAEVDQLGAAGRQPSTGGEELSSLPADRLQSRIERAIDRLRHGVPAEPHDEPLQPLWAADSLLEVSRALAPAPSNQVAVAQQGVRQALSRLRELMLPVRPVDTGKQPLDQRLEALVDVHRQRRPVTRFALRTDGLDAVGDPDVADSVHRIVGEALANVTEHARASTATVEVRASGNAVEIEVADDGVGFDLLVTGGAAASSREGVSGMQDCAELLGGLLTVQTSPGAGTTVRVLLPLRQPAPIQSVTV